MGGFLFAGSFLSIVLIIYQAVPVFSVATPSTCPRAPPSMLENIESSTVAEELGLKEWKEVESRGLVDGLVRLIDGDGRETVVVPKYTPSPLFMASSNSGVAFVAESMNYSSPSLFDGSLCDNDGLITPFEIDATGQGHIGTPEITDFGDDVLNDDGTPFKHNHGHNHQHKTLPLSSIDNDKQGRRSLLTRFENCYPHSELKHRLNIGIVLTNACYELWCGGNITTASAMIDILVRRVNEIYVSQLNVELHVTELIVMTDAGKGVNGSLSWNTGPNERCPKIGESLKAFRHTMWQKSEEYPSQALWILIDDCRRDISSQRAPDERYIGLAYNGKACRNVSYKVAEIRIRTRGNEWWYFAHELGHLLGAHHSFEEGVGTTGGIMDYGNTTAPGNDRPGFNEKYRKLELCTVSEHFARNWNIVWIEIEVANVE